MVIREWEQDDGEACVRVLLDAYNREPWNNQWTRETAERYLGEFVSSKDFFGFVACREGGEVVGAMFAHGKTWWTGDEAYVDELFVRSDCQRQGYGKALIRQGEDYCKTKGLTGLTLLTNRYMPAKDFYEKNGYKLAEHIAFLYKDV